MSKKKYSLSEAGTEILRILMEVTRIAKSGESVQKVFKCIFNDANLQTMFKFTKAYLAQLDRHYNRYKIKDVGGNWSEESKQKLQKFMGKTSWRKIEEGKLYRKILGRADPWRPLLIPDFKDSPIILEKYKEILEIESAIASLIILDRKRKGIILIGFSQKHEEDMSGLSEILIGQVDLAGKTTYIETEEELGPLRWNVDIHYGAAIRLSSDLNVLDGLSGYDVYKHSVRVTHVCYEIAKRMKISPQWLIYLLTCALLHDFGKRFVLEPLAKRKEPIKEVTKAEKKVLSQHPEYGFELVWKEYGRINESFDWALPILCHHCSSNIDTSQPLRVTNPKVKEIIKKIRIEPERLYGQLRKYKKAWLNNEIIRVADAIEDDVIDRLYRGKPENVRVRLERIQEEQQEYFSPQVLEALEGAKGEIIKNYEREHIEPPSVNSLFNLLSKRLKSKGGYSDKTKYN